MKRIVCFAVLLALFGLALGGVTGCKEAKTTFGTVAADTNKDKDKDKNKK